MVATLPSVFNLKKYRERLLKTFTDDRMRVSRQWVTPHALKAKKAAIGSPADMTYVLGLVPVAQATVTAVASGPWSSLVTWGGRLPQANDKVVIPAQFSVKLDTATPKLKWLRVDGTLSVKEDTDTTLWCELVVTTMGSNLIMGSDTVPITGMFKLLLADFGPLDIVADPKVMGRALIVMGNWSGCGKPTDVWANIFLAKRGDQTITFQNVPVNFAVNDPIVISGRKSAGFSPSAADPGNEEVTITGLQPQTLNGIPVLVATLDKQLRVDHLSPLDNPTVVMNRKQRNIHFTSENTSDITRQGHIMVMNGNMTDLCHFSVVGVLRTNKTIPVTDPDGLGGGTSNARGRYAFHIHENGPDVYDVNGNLNPVTTITGAYIECPFGWGFVNHDSRVFWIGCGVYKVGCGAFVTEIGTETGRRTSCRSIGQLIPNIVLHDTDYGNSDFAHNEYDFWQQVPLEVDDNNGSACIIFPLEIMGNPFLTGKNSGGPEYFSVKNLPAGLHPTDPTLVVVLPRSVPCNITNYRSYAVGCAIEFWQVNLAATQGVPPIPAWFNSTPVEVGYSLVDGMISECGSGILVEYSSALHFRNCKFHGPGRTADPTQNNSAGFSHSGVMSSLWIENCSYDGFDTGVGAPTHVLNSISGNFSNCNRGIGISNTWGATGREIDINCTFSNNVQDIAMRWDQQGHSAYLGPNDLLGDPLFWFMSLCMSPLNEDRLTYNGKPAFFPEMAPGYALNNLPICPPEFAGQTNAYLQTFLGTQLGGAIVPLDVVPIPNSLGYYSPGGTKAKLVPYLYTNDWSWQNAGNNGGFGGRYWQNVMIGADHVNFKNQNFQWQTVPYPSKVVAGKQWVPTNIDGVTRNVLVQGVTGTANDQMAFASNPDNPGPYESKFISQNVPAAVQIGQKGHASITFENLGTRGWGNSWPNIGSLGYAGPNGAGHSVWGVDMIPPGVTVLQGQTYTWEFDFTAPNAPGTYAFIWRITQGVQWELGDNSTPVYIVVTGTPPQTVAVPNVVGLAFSIAVVQIQAAGLVISPTSVTDPTLRIATQTPAAGVQVATGSTVAVTQVAPPTVTVPNLIGLTFTAAAQSLQALGLVISPASVSDPTLAIATQMPAANTQVAPGSTVIITQVAPPNPPTCTLTISPLSIQTGQSATVAWTSQNATSVTLNGAAVALSGSQVVSPSQTTQYNLVAAGPGGTAKQSATLTVTVPQVTVPDMTTPKKADAQAAAAALGLPVEEHYASQSPAAGTQVPPGTTIKVS